MQAEAIEYFAVVARTGSIAKAAAEIGIEPSTLARHIGRLERASGLKLFHRSGRGMVLTDGGTRFREEAERVVQALGQARRAAGDLAAGGPSQIVLAAQPTIAQILFGPLAHALRARFPNARIRLNEGLGNQVLQWLQDGETDLAIMYVPLNPHIVDYDLLLQEPLYVLLPPDHSVPPGPMPVAHFLDLPLVLPSTAHGVRALVESWAQRHGKRLNLRLEHDGSTFVTRRLVQAGHGCTIGPLAAAHDEIQRGLLRCAPLAGPDTRRTVAIVSARNRAPIEGLQAVRQLLREAASQLVRTGQWHGVERLAE